MKFLIAAVILSCMSFSTHAAEHGPDDPLTSRSQHVENDLKFLTEQLKPIEGAYVVDNLQYALRLKIERIFDEDVLLVDLWMGNNAIMRLFEVSLRRLSAYHPDGEKLEASLLLGTEAAPRAILYGNRKAPWSLRILSLAPDDKLSLRVLHNEMPVFQISKPEMRSLARVPAAANKTRYLVTNYGRTPDGLAKFLDGEYPRPKLVDDCVSAIKGFPTDH